MSGLGDDDGFTVLDDEGRLFGLVNIVDLLVVLLVLAVVVAGAALLLSDSPGEADTRQVTMDLGQQPEFIAEQITAGDTFEPQGTNDSVTITDVYRVEGGDGVNVVVRATVRGTGIEPEDPDDDPTFQFRDNELQIGQQMPIQTSEYSVQGQVTRIQRSGESLPTQQREFTIETTVPAGTADQVSVGDTYDVAGDSVAEITAVQQFPSQNQGQRLLRIGLSAQTIDRGTVRFANTPLRIGNTVPFRGENYQLNGAIRRLGSSTIDTQVRPFIVETTVPADIVEDIDEGDEYRLNDQTLVRIESTTFYPTGNANQRQALLGVSVRSSEEDGTVVFGDRELRFGQSIPIQTAEYDISGTITRRGTSTVETELRPFIVETTVPADIAEDIEEGDEYRLDGRTLVRVDSTTFYPTGNANQRRAFLGVSVRSSEEDGTIIFGDRELRFGQSIPIQTAEYDISSTITRRGTNTVETALRPFVIETTVPVSVAEDIDPGDEYRLGEQTLVRVESTTFYTADQPDQRRAVLGVSALTREDDGTILFGNRELRLGGSLPVQTAEYIISGEITRRDSTDEPGQPGMVTTTLDIRNIRPEIAAAIEEGETEQIGEQTLVEVVSKTTEPAEIILESEGGEIFLREHPRNLDVELETNLQIRELEDGSLRFRGESLRTGDTIVLELGQLRINAQVTAIEN